MTGAEVPALECEHFYLLTKPIDGITGNMPILCDHDSHLYIRDDSGGLLVGRDGLDKGFVSWMRDEFDWHGMAWHRAAERA